MIEKDYTILHLMISFISIFQLTKLFISQPMIYQIVTLIQIQTEFSNIVCKNVCELGRIKS